MPNNRLLFVCLFCFVCFSWGDEAEASRKWGIGSAVGIGFSYNTIPTIAPLQMRWGPQGNIANLELRLFLKNGHSLDFFSQLGNTLAGAILAAVPRAEDEEGVLFFTSFVLLYNFNIRIKKGYFLLALGPEMGMDIGVGGSYTKSRPVKIHIRLASRIGYEFMLHKSLGLQLMLRAFFEPFGYTGLAGKDHSSVGVGALFEVALIQYHF